MSSVNPITKEILLKVVYYGPGLGGKTTTLQHIHKTTPTERRGKMVSLATPVDRTLYFDFLPVELPKINDYTLRLHIFTVPGQVYFNATRKLVLNGADGVVFVADSQLTRMDANIESLDNLKENLQDHGKVIGTFPVVMQYNKRDLPNITSIDEMQAQLNPNGLPWIATSALTGDGVHKSLALITKNILRDIKNREGLMPGLKERSEVLDSKIAFTREESGINDTVANFSRSSQMAEPPETTNPMESRPDSDSLSMALPAAADELAADSHTVPVSSHTEDFSDDPPDELPSLHDSELGAELGGLTAPGIAVPDLTDEIEEEEEEEEGKKEEKGIKLTPLEAATADIAMEHEGHTRPGISPPDNLVLESSQPASPTAMSSGPSAHHAARKRPDRPTIPSPPISSESIPAVSAADMDSQPMTIGSSSLSFAALWPMPQRHIAEDIERLIADGQDHRAVLAIWKEIGRLVDTAAEALPGAPRESVVVLLGVDGRKYVELARLAQMASSEKALAHSSLLEAYLLLLNLVRSIDC